MFGKKCVKFKGAAPWNDIPTSIKSIILRPSINFKKLLKIICQVSIINNVHVLHKCYVYAVH